jgi:hypothetical protein
MRSLRSALVLIIAASIMLGAGSTARADGGPFGLGIMLGSPTGLSLKYYLGKSGQAIDGGVGEAFGGYGGLQVHVDYLWHPVMLARSAAFNLPLHFGIGARLLDHDRGRDYHDEVDDSHLHIGVRVPVGLTFDFTKVPLDAFIEVALVVDAIAGDHRHEDDIGVDLNAAIGVRYYF